MKDIILCDTHSDTASRAYDLGEGLYKNTLDLDIKRLSEYKSYMQVFAAFISPKHYFRARERAYELIGFIKKEIEKNSAYVSLCLNNDDILSAWKNNKTAAMISIEGGECIGTMGDIEDYYKEGVRMIAPVWNNDNLLSGGAKGDGRGLSGFGKEAVLKMNSLGIICDVSHMSEKAFWDTIDISQKPVIASHSSSYQLCKNKRNLTDEQFIALKNSQGVCGINFYPEFLREEKNADISDIARHIVHFLSLGGEDNICIGSDLDGIDTKPKGFKGVEDMWKIFDLMAKSGIDRERMNKIAYKNIQRLMGICL